MGRFDGDYTVSGGTVYDESRRVVSLLQQQQSPIVDVMLNTAFYAQYLALRRLIQSTFKNGTPFGAFRIEAIATAVTNDFLIAGGLADSGWGTAGLADNTDTTGTDGEYTGQGPARFFVGGHVALLPNTRNWTDATVIGEPEIHSTITALSTSTLTDTSAFFGELGQPLTDSGEEVWVAINIDDTGGIDGGGSANNLPRMYKITSYTATTLTFDLSNHSTYNASTDTFVAASPAQPITALSDVTSVGKHYRFYVPASATNERVDSLYLDVYYDEMDSDDDGIVKRPIGGAATESANFGFVKQRLEWIPGYNGGTVSIDATHDHDAVQNNLYEVRTDGDGNVHHRVLLAVFEREMTGAGDPDLENSKITQYHNNPYWGLTLGSLPPVDTTPSTNQVDGAGEGTTSVGFNKVPGRHIDSTGVLAELDIPNLLLQSLGNVSEAMNQAFQNMGDYNNGSDQPGVPGIGTSDRDSTPFDDNGHLLLGTNGEQAAIINRYDGDNPGYQNTYVTVDSHKGLAMDTGTGTATTGQLASHAIESTFTSGATSLPSDYIDVGVVNGNGGVGGSSWGNAGIGSNSTLNVSQPPAPILYSVVELKVTESTGVTSEGTFFVNMGIDCTGYLNIDDLLADYNIQAFIAHRNDTPANMQVNHVNGTHGLDIATGENLLGVYVGFDPNNSTDAMKASLVLLGFAKGS